MNIPPVEITVFRKRGGPLTKRIFLSEDGCIHSDASRCVMVRGEAARYEFSSMQSLADLIDQFDPENALATGSLRADLPDVVEIVTKQQLNGGHNTGIICRSQEFLLFRPRYPALALLDFDKKGMPPAVAALIERLGGVWSALVTLVPELTKAARLERASTSAGLFDERTGQSFPESGGRHFYVVLVDGTDSARFLQVLHERAWLAGLGWMMVGAAGQLLERSIVDRVVGGAERLAFEGRPVLVAPVAQDVVARRPVVVDGERLDSLAACPPLNAAERAKLAELRAKERHRLAGESAKAREAFIERQSARLVERTGMSPRRACSIVERQCEGILLPDLELLFDDPELAGKTVADVLADPVRFEGETLADPLEGIEYGVGKARIMLRADGSVWIHSFAHGRTVYELKIDFAACKAALERASNDDVVALLVWLVLRAELDEAEIELLKHTAAGRCDVGIRAIAATLKAARKAEADRLALEERNRRLAERRDPRPRLPAPPSDAPWLPQVAAINDVLSKSQALEPPTRDFEGFLNFCRVSRAPGLHSLTSAGANATEANTDRIPPPEHLRLSRLDEVETAELIERHIEYVIENDDEVHEVHLHPAFVKHYFKRREDPALPRLHTIVQMPLVLPNGEILTGQGLNREMNAIFRVPKELNLPTKEGCAPPNVSKMMRFLTDDWLCDVTTDYMGKCVIIALCLTIIERGLLTQRPGFFVSSGKRGGGKTTTLNMAAMAVLGTVAPAAAWSPSEEERRKALFSYFLEDDPFVVFDNINRGATISCPHTERALTAEFFTDRVLGVSERKIVPITTVLGWTGNKIAPRGDLSSRILRALITVDRPDPENRVFRHPDPIEWTRRNRGKILYALYTIMLGNPLLRQPVNARTNSLTRFKVWWEVAGSAIEHAALICADEDHGLVADPYPWCPATKIDFARELIEKEEGDEENAGLADLLALLLKRWPNGFMARHVATYLEPDGLPPEEAAREMQSCIERAAGKPLRPISSSTVSSALKKFTDSPVTNGDGSVLELKCIPDRKKGDSFRIKQSPVKRP